MKIFVNDSYEILSIDNQPVFFSWVFEVNQTREELFGNLCDICIQGYRYEPSYQFMFNQDGSNAKDNESGELLYKHDDKGNRVSNGYMCYPYIDHKTLMLIQKQYEDSQRQVQALNAQIEYLSMMSGIETEVNHE